MQWKPNVTVAAVIEREGRYLVVEEEESGRRVYNQPAGHLERDESLLDAVRREVLEETAWEFEPEAVVGVYLYPEPLSGITYLRVCFTGSCTRHLPERGLDHCIIRAVWMSREELAACEERLRSVMVLRCIDDYLAGNRCPLELVQHVRVAHAP